MRILILNNEFPPLGGGQGVVNEVLLHAWENEPGLQIDCVVGSCNESKPKVEEITRNAKLHRVRLFNKNLHHSSNRDLLRFLFDGSRVAHSLAAKNRYDLCFAFSAVPAGAIAFGLKRRFGIPYITRSPGVDIPGFEARYNWLYPIISPVIRTIWRNAALNIASSSHHLELMKRVEPSAKFEMIPNGVDGELFTPSKKLQGQSVVLCVARLVKRKGIDLLIRAFGALAHEFPEARLRLVGTGDDESELKALVSELKLESRVDFLGAVAREAMPEIYRSSDIFVLPSWNEGMSNAALEALASGLPIIMSDVGGANELVEHGSNGFRFTAGVVSELEGFLRTSLGSSQLRKEMSAVSRKRSESFQWSKIASIYLKSLTLPPTSR